VNITVPVTMSGSGYSSPIFFQYSTFANSCSNGSRSCLSLIPLRRRADGLAEHRLLRCASPSEADSIERQHVGVDDAQFRLVRKLAALAAAWSRGCRHVLGAPAMKPAISTRWNGRHVQLRAGSSFRWDLVIVAAAPNATSESPRLLVSLASRAVIDFLNSS
jgi:hypothetical protein